MTDLWAHQKDCIERATKETHFAIFHEAGVGKTRTVLEILRHHFNSNKRIMRTMVVAPLIVTRNWEAEIQKYTKLPRNKYMRLGGQILDRAKQLGGFEGLIITNYESFINPKFTDAVLKWKPEILILDESHGIKNPAAKRTKAIHKVCESMGENGLRFILTGTPLASNQLDIWSQFYSLDLGKTFGRSFYGFRGAYFHNLNSGRPHLTFPMWVIKPGADDAIKKKIAPKSSIAKKKDCIDLPPLIEETIEVELTPEQKRVYKEMKNDLIAFVESNACVATIALTKALRLQQIVSGYLPLEDGTVKQLPSNRPQALRDLLDTLPSDAKVIIWAVFRNDYSTVAEVLKKADITYTEAHGLISNKEKYDNIERFKADPKIRALIGSPAAIGIGVNVVEAQYSIWFSRNFSMVQDEQSAARNFRAGSTMHQHVTRYDIIAPDTIDQTVLESVKQKYKMAEKILKSAKNAL